MGSASTIDMVIYDLLVEVTVLMLLHCFHRLSRRSMFSESKHSSFIQKEYSKFTKYKVKLSKSYAINEKY